jgi:hypothetical protein
MELPVCLAINNSQVVSYPDIKTVDKAMHIYFYLEYDE